MLRPTSRHWVTAGLPDAGETKAGRTTAVPGAAVVFLSPSQFFRGFQKGQNNEFHVSPNIK